MLEKRIPENRICFSFNYFKEESIRIPNFNNFYKDKLASINSVNDFIDVIREMGKYTKDELFSNNIKKMFHLNQIYDNKSIDLIERVLVDGYGFPQQFVDNFERTYIEFSTKNGKRVIAALMYGTLFECLFLDPNHFICPKKSRNIKFKESFIITSAFQKWDKEIIDLEEPMLKDYLEMLIEDYENGKFEKIDDAMETLKEVVK